MRELTDGRGADVILELVGAPHFPGNLEALAPKGRIVIVGVGGGQEITLPLLTLMQRRATIRGTVLRARPLEEKGTVVRAFEKEVVPALASGRMRPLVDSVFAADEAAAAFDRLDGPGKVGQGAARVRVNRRALPLIEGRGPSQVGIVVPDIEAALERYESLWGGGPWRCFVYGPERLPEVTYRGKPGHYSATIAINQLVPQIELIQPSRRAEHLPRVPRSRGARAPPSRLLGRLGPGVVREMEQAGYPCVQAGFGYGLDGDGGYAYFDTEPTSR